MKSIKFFILLIISIFIIQSCKKEEKEEFEQIVEITFNPSITYGNMTDQDGNTYKTVTIGSHVWMAENLRTTKYNNGSAIPLVTKNNKWSELTTPGYCWYMNSRSTYGNVYGALYNWYAVNTGKLCPAGWHVPTYEEGLTTFLGGENAGGKLKEIGTTHWPSPNKGATNESGFSAIPSGYRFFDGTFEGTYYGFWWSSTEWAGAYADYLALGYNSSDLIGSFDWKKNGLSVRCVRDI